MVRKLTKVLLTKSLPEESGFFMVTDTQKTLQALREAGDKGIHSFVLNKFVGTIRAGARIYDLKKKGYHISSIPERMNDAVGCRYFLHETPKPIKQYTFINGVCTEQTGQPPFTQQGFANKKGLDRPLIEQIRLPQGI